MKHIKMITLICLVLVASGAVYVYTSKETPPPIDSMTANNIEKVEDGGTADSPTSTISTKNTATSTEKPTINPESTLGVQATAMNQAFLAKDYETFATFVNPKLIEVMGGKQRFLSVTREGMKGIESEGWVLTGITFEKPFKLIYTDKEIQTVLTQNMKGNIPGGKITVKSYLIATSNNGGKNWYFFDTDGKSLKTLTLAFPNLSSQLYIPPTVDPVFEYDAE